MAFVFGTGRGDNLTGSAFRDLIFGRSGDDTIEAGDGSDWAFGGRGLDSIDGGAGHDALFGGAGGDILKGGEGNDLLRGGRGEDTAVYEGASTDYDLGFRTDSSGRVVSFRSVADLNTADGDEGKDWLSSIETLSFAGDGVVISLATSVQLVNGDGSFGGFFDTIQGAVDAASDGGTIFVPDGVYEEQVIVSGLNDLTIEGASKDGVIVRAPAGGPVASLDDALAPSFATGDVFGVIMVDGASNIEISGLTVDGAGLGGTQPVNTDNYAGVLFHNASGEVADVTVTGVRDPLDIDGNLAGAQRGNGVYVTNDDGTQRSFSLSDSTVTDFQKTGVLIRNADVSITGNTIDGLAPAGGHTTIVQNGVQLSNGSTGVVDGNTITGIGYTNAADPNTDAGAVLLFDTVDLDVTNNDITGSSSQDIGVFSISSSGLLVSGNTFNDLDFGVDDRGTIAVDNDTNGQNNTFNNVNTGIQAFPSSDQNTVFIETGSDLADVLIGSNANDVFNGAGGDDLFFGQGGDDDLDGGAGADSAFYTGALTDYSILTAAGVTTVTDNRVDGADGVDTLMNIETLIFSDTEFLV